MSRTQQAARQKGPRPPRRRQKVQRGLPFSLKLDDLEPEFHEQALTLEEAMNNRWLALKAKGHSHNRAITKTTLEFNDEVRRLTVTNALLQKLQTINTQREEVAP